MSLEFKGMKYTSVILAAALALLPVGAAAQTEESLDPEVGGRVAFTLDKKIVKGLHVSIEKELRFDNNFGAFDRFHTTLGASYKVLPYLKVGLGYSLINGYSSSNSAFKTPRHRAFVDVTGSYRFGDWTVSLRERVQMTHRTDSFNEYQNPANAWALKSRVKVTYKGLRRWEPYASFELRNTLNAPTVSAVYNEASGTWGYYNGSTFTTAGEAGWFLDGFNNMYVDRLRGTLGVEYRIDRRSKLDVSLMVDYNMEKSVDANAEGTKLKAYTEEKGLMGWLCVGYSYGL